MFSTLKTIFHDLNQKKFGCLKYDFYHCKINTVAIQKLSSATHVFLYHKSKIINYE
jgi:hypothetical protein